MRVPPRSSVKRARRASRHLHAGRSKRGHGERRGTARVWHVERRSGRALVGRHDGPGRAVAFGPGGSIGALAWTGRFACGGTGRGPVDPTAGRRVDVAASPDGRCSRPPASTAGRLWRAADGSLIRSFAHGAPLTAVAFDASGGRLATAGADGRRASGARRPGGRNGSSGTAVPDGCRSAATACASRRRARTGSASGASWTAACSAARRPRERAHLDRVQPERPAIVTASLDADARIWELVHGPATLCCVATPPS